ncbi:MAG TPA: hypothetical protein PKY30_08765 [Myxococcota bacterium]|nr:hypothetical protein [Myxococcota bacterium]HNH47117.1 hypothetical protein [Myxococcota bacterium]
MSVWIVALLLHLVPASAQEGLGRVGITMPQVVWTDPTEPCLAPRLCEGRIVVSSDQRR